MEIGLTGGEEDGVDNTGADNNSLYTQPNEVFDVYKALAPISPNFSIAAAFGNVHGVYKPGNVVLRPELLGKHQEFAREQLKGKGGDQPLFLVFHGGSGSEESEIQTAVKNGVVKMNVDTDTQVRTPSFRVETFTNPSSVGLHDRHARLLQEQGRLPRDPGR
jgi:fructose-bisphosphate aldolase class II